MSNLIVFQYYIIFFRKMKLLTLFYIAVHLIQTNSCHDFQNQHSFETFQNKKVARISLKKI